MEGFCTDHWLMRLVRIGRFSRINFHDPISVQANLQGGACLSKAANGNKIFLNFNFSWLIQQAYSWGRASHHPARIFFLEIAGRSVLQ